MARLLPLFRLKVVRVVGACLVLVVGVGLVVPAEARQDTTTMLSLFLRDLRAGTLGTLQAITSMKTATLLVDTISLPKTTPDVSLSRGAANVLQLASGDMFSFGGVTSSQPMLKASANSLQVKLADDSAFSDLKLNNLILAGGPVVISSTAPTVTSAGTSPSVVANGTASFRVNVGTGGTATTIVLALPAATTGWNCDASNITGAAANRANQHIVQQSSTTTAATLQQQTISTGVALAFTASDIVRVICFAY